VRNLKRRSGCTLWQTAIVRNCVAVSTPSGGNRTVLELRISGWLFAGRHRQRVRPRSAFRKVRRVQTRRCKQGNISRGPVLAPVDSMR
jgi:hypothetical protein